MSFTRLADACYQAGQYQEAIKHLYTVEKMKNDATQVIEDDLLLETDYFFKGFSVLENMKKKLELDHYFNEKIVLGVLFHTSK